MTTTDTATDALLRTARGTYGGTPMDTLAVNTVRTLCMDAVQRAKSGHPGTPMGMAPVVYTLWQRFLRFDPQDPTWPNRDRFVLSPGHASVVLYAMLHLTGVQAVDAEYERVGELAVRLQDLDSACRAGQGSHRRRPRGDGRHHRGKQAAWPWLRPVGLSGRRSNSGDQRVALGPRPVRAPAGTSGRCTP